MSEDKEDPPDWDTQSQSQAPEGPAPAWAYLAD